MDFTTLLEDFFERQLSVWPLAQENFARLGDCCFREMPLDDFPCRLMHNPARIVSGAAKIDKASVAARKCFLCESNRPKEQQSLPLPGCDSFEALVNPYPVFSPHFVIASRSHCDQSGIPEEMLTVSSLAPEYAFFYNGAKSGASAPDHLHFQAVKTDNLPFLRMVETIMKTVGESTLKSLGLKLPHDARVFCGDKFVSRIFGISDNGLLNVFVWTGNDGVMRGLYFPRTAHRPSCYYAGGDDNYMVSPGCLEMAGIVILPRSGDFERISPVVLDTIYAETGVEII